MRHTMEVGGYQAAIQFDPDIEMFRGEFVGLNGGADFYARDIAGLRREGVASLKVFLDMCREDGAEPRRQFDERFAQATRDARAILSEIVTQVNPRRIYQWGSLLDRKRFSEISDVDIAVEGLNGPAEFFQVLGIAMNGTALPVDVVELERVPADVAERIRERGALVHERRDPW